MKHEYKELDYDVVSQVLNLGSLNTRTAIYVVGQNKGGVGKTTFTGLMAQVSVEFLKKRVLIIDLDPQGNISSCYIKLEEESLFQLDASKTIMPPIHPDYISGEFTDEERPCFTDLFAPSPEGGVIGLYPYISDHNPDISIVPAYSSKLIRYREVAEATMQIAKNNPDINEVEELRMISSDPDYRADLKRRIVMNIADSILSVRDDISNTNHEDGGPLFHSIIIDTPPDKSLLVEAACIAADHVVFPFQSDAFNLDGSKSMFNFISIVNQMRESAGHMPCKITFQPNNVNGSRKNQLRDLNAFASSEKINGKINFPLRQVSKLSEMLMYRPGDISLTTHFKGAKTYLTSIQKVIMNILGEK